jgi:hypothetical protein
MDSPSIALPGADVPAALPAGRLRLNRVVGDWQLADSTLSAASVDGTLTSFGVLAVRLSAPAGSCAGPEFRTFDFWVGDWSVQDRTQPKFNQASRSSDAYGRRKRTAPLREIFRCVNSAFGAHQTCSQFGVGSGPKARTDRVTP